jgi:hypothetical protein
VGGALGQERCAVRDARQAGNGLGLLGLAGLWDGHPQPRLEVLLRVMVFGGQVFIGDLLQVVQAVQADGVLQ